MEKKLAGKDKDKDLTTKTSQGQDDPGETHPRNTEEEGDVVSSANCHGLHCWVYSLVCSSCCIPECAVWDICTLAVTGDLSVRLHWG